MSQQGAVGVDALAEELLRGEDSLLPLPGMPEPASTTLRAPGIRSTPYGASPSQQQSNAGRSRRAAGLPAASTGAEAANLAMDSISEGNSGFPAIGEAPRGEPATLGALHSPSQATPVPMESLSLLVQNLVDQQSAMLISIQNMIAAQNDHFIHRPVDPQPHVVIPTTSTSTNSKLPEAVSKGCKKVQRAYEDDVRRFLKAKDAVQKVDAHMDFYAVANNESQLQVHPGAKEFSSCPTMKELDEPWIGDPNQNDEHSFIVRFGPTESRRDVLKRLHFFVEKFKVSVEKERADDHLNVTHAKAYRSALHDSIKEMIKDISSTDKYTEYDLEAPCLDPITDEKLLDKENKMYRDALEKLF